MTKPIPEGLHSLTPQLNIDGAAEAMELYKKAFGAVELMRAPDPTGKKIWHASMKIGNSTFFVNDVFPDMGPGAGASKTKMWFYTEKCDEAFKHAVDAGCQSRMAPMDMFWGDRMGQVADKWGNEWTIATHIKDLTPDEMKKAEQEFIAKMKQSK